MIGVMPGALAGMVGLVIGIALSEIFFYPVLRGFTHKPGIWNYLPDLAVLVVMMLFIIMGWHFRGWPI